MMKIKINCDFVKSLIVKLFVCRIDYRRYINLFFLALLAIEAYHYLFSNEYNSEFKLHGRILFIFPFLGFASQSFYPTIFGWIVQTYINGVYMYNSLSSYAEVILFNSECKWTKDYSLIAFQSLFFEIVAFVLFSIFLIPGKDKKILNIIKKIFISSSTKL